MESDVMWESLNRQLFSRHFMFTLARTLAMFLVEPYESSPIAVELLSLLNSIFEKSENEKILLCPCSIKAETI